jgi:hypothetical protein
MTRRIDTTSTRPERAPIVHRPRERRCPECGETFWTWAPNHGPECSERCKRAATRKKGHSNGTEN